MTMKQVILSAPTREGLGIDSLSLAESRHRALDARLKELGKRIHLTPREQLEMSEIKKHKLLTKDEIANLRRVFV